MLAPTRLGVALLLTSASLLPASESARGPSEIRDEHLFAQPRLTLPAVGTHVTPPGRWTFRLTTLWSNSFAWSQNVSGEAPERRDFLVDGEALTVDLTVRRGLRRGWDVAARVPFRWRGGGRMDGLIDRWHRIFRLPDNQRPSFRTNAFRVEGLQREGSPFSWSPRTGGSVGDVEIETRWRVRERRQGLSLASLARLSLPTAGEPFSGNGVGAAGQLALSAPLGRRLDAYAGAGVSRQCPCRLHTVEYAPLRCHAFAALELRPWSRFSLLAETNAATRLVTNIRRYPSLHWLLNVTGRLDVGRRARLDLGFTENIMSQDSTTDFALYAAVGLRP